MLLRVRKGLDDDGRPLPPPVIPPAAVRAKGMGDNVGRNGSCSSDVRLYDDVLLTVRFLLVDNDDDEDDDDAEDGGGGGDVLLR